MISQKTTGEILIVVSIILLFVLAFVKANADKQSAFLCEIIDATPNVSMEQCPAHQNNTTSWLLVIAFGISFVFLTVGVYLTFAKDKFTKKIDVSKLDQEEKKIYDLLKEKGSMYQSDLIKETEFSKVKITRVLDRMASKDIVDRQRRGMTNIVVLK